jgi:translocation and assembly module TamB
VEAQAEAAEEEPLGGALGSSSLRAGKYLTEDVFVRVDQGLRPESRRVGVEVRVLPETLPNVTVESDVGADARTSFGINWRYDY